jgi:hypothetical protein
MALFPLGILSAAGAGGAFSSDYELITSTVLGSTQSDFVFSSLGDYSSTYKHLQIRATIRGGKSAGDVPLILRLNGITTASYRWHFLYGNGSSVFSTGAGSADTGMYFGNPVPGATSTSNNFCGAVIDILDPYSTTKNKTLRGLFGTTSPNSISLASGALFDTASVTSVTIYPDTGGWVAGSRFSLYGIKG